MTQVNFRAKLEIDQRKTLRESRVFEEDVLFIEVDENLLLNTSINAHVPDIWLEPTNPETIVYVSGPGVEIVKSSQVIASATLNKLIERLTGEGDDACKY